MSAKNDSDSYFIFGLPFFELVKMGKIHLALS